MVRTNVNFARVFGTNPGYNDSNGWTSFDRYPRQVGDVNGDGRADIVGFASDQVYVALAKITPVNNNPNISINDVRLFEGNSGNKTARFTVTLTGRTQENVSVLYSTANGTATAGSDFTPLVGTLSFIRSNATRQTQTISIPVRGDRTPERDETFFVNLSSAINADIRDSRGIGTIKNDDDSLMKFLDDFSQGSPLNAGLDQIGSVFLSK